MKHIERLVNTKGTEMKTKEPIKKTYVELGNIMLAQPECLKASCLIAHAETANRREYVDNANASKIEPSQAKRGTLLEFRPTGRWSLFIEGLFYGGFPVAFNL